ncbi:MAG: hypothetical protein D6753_17010 [Planctomycetota bacterium]|nr:MAG: hypothetical protein D6753_17010 [Planctomycetota bacterium]
MAVCDKTFRLLQRAPYSSMFEFIAPRREIPLDQAAPFQCRRARIRHPQETKGEDYHATTAAPSSCCGPDSQCC